MEARITTDSAAAARRARFGTLPERVRYEDLVEEQQAVPNGATRNGPDPEASWNHFNCLALDLGL
ncbi:hypothetical protein [Streptomyces sp. 8L]|uniref:hypothetical protein n=1 Tax=Streptomyces sp. 8L TaxID=2877242 RepID=UPI001CD1F311|nr:hypothetical protein [Streptomyces sp. 8L]MCA1223211.1 hypothetical protein [Streptomyces sp. 8L]